MKSLKAIRKELKRRKKSIKLTNRFSRLKPSGKSQKVMKKRMKMIWMKMKK